MSKRPNPFLWLPLAGLLKLDAFFSGNRVVEKTKIKRPAIILSNHTSFNDFIYTTAAAYPLRISYLAAAKMFYEKGKRPFLRLARAIPKSLFQSDLRSVVSALDILKQKGIVSIFPEGQISSYGASQKSPFSIAKFLKKAGVNVYIIQHRNVGLMAPPWSTRHFRGPTFTSVKSLLSAEEIKTLDEKAIYQKVEEGLYFNSGDFNRIHRYRYRVSDVANLENLIYECPECGHEGLSAKGKTLVCPHCGHTMTYDDYGFLEGKSIFEHYQRQRETLSKRIEADSQFKLTANVSLERYEGKTIAMTGQGQLTLDKEKYLYVGTDRGKEVTYRFSVKTVEYIPTDIGKNIQIYDGYEVFQFRFEIPHLPTQFVIAGEQLYRL